MQNFKTCLSVSNKLCGILVSQPESPTIFDESFRVTSVAFFIIGFDLSNCELNHFKFAVLSHFILILY